MSMLKYFFEYGCDQAVFNGLEIADETELSKRIHQELTYRDLYKDVEHLWSVLFATGYLTQRKMRDKDEYGLVIPNLEIRQIFVDQIREWFQEVFWNCSAIGKTGILTLMLSQETDTAIFWWKQKKIQDL